MPMVRNAMAMIEYNTKNHLKLILFTNILNIDPIVTATKLNSNEDHVIFTTAQQPHFNNTQELIDFATKNSDSVRGLPHGYCTKGAGCKIKNASDPSHCLYCDTYYVTPSHLPYWKAIKSLFPL